MDFWKAILGLARRKLIVIPLLVASIVAALAGYFLTPLYYVSSTTMVLIPPTREGISKDPRAIPLTNPMLNYGNNLKAVSSILIQAMNTPEVAAELGAGDGSPTQLTVDDRRSSPQPLDGAPFVYIVGKSTSAAAAKDVVIQAQERVRQDLVDRRSSVGAPPGTYLTLVDVVAPTMPKAIQVERIKVGGIALVLSLIFGLGAAYAWHSRRARRHWPAGAESSLLVQDDVDSSRDEERHGHPVRAPDRRFAETPARRADTDVTDTEQPIDDGVPDLKYGVTPDQQAVSEEQLTDDEYGAADHELAVVAEQSTQPENAAYASQEEMNEVWDLYIVDHSPAGEWSADGSQDDTLDWNLEGDWSLEGLHSERDSEAVGAKESH